jgi:hypothetical protein
MLSVTYALCHLCWALLLLGVTDALCHLCCVLLMLCAAYAECCFFWVSLILKVAAPVLRLLLSTLIFLVSVENFGYIGPISIFANTAHFYLISGHSYKTF